MRVFFLIGVLLRMDLKLMGNVVENYDILFFFRFLFRGIYDNLLNLKLV